ncbi:hypothetical protein [Flexithrix dorotheae]|nr:hypothetical protein [Flexithrix dorotheae]
MLSKKRKPVVPEDEKKGNEKEKKAKKVAEAKGSITDFLDDFDRLLGCG